jgi:hypothetical protein
MLETNSLGGGKRNPWYNCGNWRSVWISQDFALPRQQKTDVVVGVRPPWHFNNSSEPDAVPQRGLFVLRLREQNPSTSNARKLP